MPEDENKRWLQVMSHGVLYDMLKQSDRVPSQSEKFTETEIVAVPKDSHFFFSMQAVLSTKNSFWRTNLLTQPITETEQHLNTVNWVRLALYDLKDWFLSYENPLLCNDAVVKQVLAIRNVAVLRSPP